MDAKIEIDPSWVTDLDELSDRLRAALAVPLPGATAQAVMAPRPRTGWRPQHIPAEVRQAAALVLLYPLDSDLCLALTVRAPDLFRHGGQVSLPGGAMEADETVERAALREASEEVGIDASLVEVVGRLSPLHIPVSGFVLHPVVGIGRTRPIFRLDPLEVARLIELPVRALSNPASTGVGRRTHDGQTFEVPYFAADGEQIWGATAMVLSELMEVLGVALQPRSPVAPPESNET
jgi:8-oxo-dGTP pyrophosphatase MutT (NUDIX family)